jgi:hypothetical protein
MVRYRRKPITIVSAFINIYFVSCVLVLHKALFQQKNNLTVVVRKMQILRFSEQFRAQTSLWDTTPCRLTDDRGVQFGYENIPYIHIQGDQNVSVHLTIVL